MNTSCFEGVDGRSIFTRSWQPPRMRPRAVLTIVHGFNAHGGRYEWVADQCSGRGIAVSALDLRGRGRSDGERYFVESFDDYVADLAIFITLVKAANAGIPCFLLGHSAGGVVASLYSITYQTELAGLICESIAYAVPAPDFALRVLKGLSHIAPHAHVLKLHHEDFSRDPAVVASMHADPLIANEIQPTQTVVAMVRADENLKRDFGRITIPLLLLHDSADRAARADGSRQLFGLASSSYKALKIYEGVYHEPLSDLG